MKGGSYLLDTRLFLIIIIITMILCFVILPIIICPPRGFFKDMPKNILKRGNFRPYAFRFYIMKDGNPIYSKRTYKILLFAYFEARWMAWKLDYISYRDCGIAWGIKNINK